ncbi:hypothetical protein F6X51_26585 [Methylobacterium planeticum]|uniref:Uncharacterized protein n=1 Tax=Methylobacterium planeticum TaxID=2615211 RepID=A0A6N6MEE1_9HYPH|nr:hypothetical protein F6X51_26585 [Methylobacterium planeticum]
MLYHAFASPEVTTCRGNALKSFPTPAEIEALENYVFGVTPPTVEDLRARAGGAPLAVVVFASEYRPAVETVHRRHADMCHSRTGVARIGTRSEIHHPAARGYLPTVPGDGHAIAVSPCRYAAYVAALQVGLRDAHGPMHFLDPGKPTAAGDVRRDKSAGLRSAPSAGNRTRGDADRRFWIPLHKLFDGNECIAGYEISVRLAANHLNEKIRRAHLFFLGQGHNGGWYGPDIDKPPFVIRDGIAEFSTTTSDGSWLLKPVARPTLIEAAEYEGKPLTYRVPRSTGAKHWRVYESTLNLRPAEDSARKAPEYLHARHRLDADGEVNLNHATDIAKEVGKGDYWARHYVDYTADGWINVECEALALEIPRRLPAYSVIASPDFFPLVRQSQLVEWTDQSAPPDLLSAVWPVNPGRPDPLSSQRLAANLELRGAGFDPHDDTMTAIVGPLAPTNGAQRPLRPVSHVRASMLPDGASGVFAPGWDVSLDSAPADAEAGESNEKVLFLTNYGLGSPFPEDTMLCAALSSFWPAVAPDITRTFAPSRKYATATPLPDDVIGLDGSEPWDGIRGPIKGPDPDTLDYQALAYGDYVEAALAARFDLAVIGSVSATEYIARTLTMAMIYEALEATEPAQKANWTVLSFRPARPDDPDLKAAVAAHRRALDQRHTYRFEMVRHDGERRPHPDSRKFDRLIVPIKEHVLLFADPTIVLRRGTDATWAQPYERRR